MTPISADDSDRNRFEYWRAATIAVPAGTGTACALFVLLAATADANHPRFDPSPGVLVAIVAGALLVLAAALGAIRRTPRVRGAVTGLIAAALLVGFFGLMLR